MSLYYTIIIVSILAIGLISILIIRQRVKENFLFLTDFREQFVTLSNNYFSSAYAAARTTDPEIYHWLMSHVNKAQRLMGSYGVGTYIAAFRQYQINNCEFVAHLLPSFQTGKIQQEDVSIIDTSLTRALAHYRELEDDYNKMLFNPFRWLQYGIRFTISLPFRILYWLGLIQSTSVEKITGSKLFKLISGLVALISFISSVVGLIGGWQPFIDIMHKKWPGIF